MAILIAVHTFTRDERTLSSEVNRLISAAARSYPVRSLQNLANPKPRQWETCAMLICRSQRHAECRKLLRRRLPLWTRISHATAGGGFVYCPWVSFLFHFCNSSAAPHLCGHTVFVYVLCSFLSMKVVDLLLRKRTKNNQMDRPVCCSALRLFRRKDHHANIC